MLNCNIDIYSGIVIFCLTFWNKLRSVYPLSGLARMWKNFTFSAFKIPAGHGKVNLCFHFKRNFSTQSTVENHQNLLKFFLVIKKFLNIQEYCKCERLYPFRRLSLRHFEPVTTKAMYQKSCRGLLHRTCKVSWWDFKSVETNSVVTGGDRRRYVWYLQYWVLLLLHYKYNVSSISTVLAQTNYICSRTLHCGK